MKIDLKNKLRNKYKRIRSSYSKLDLSNYNSIIYENIIDFLNNSKKQNIFIYVSKNNEVDTKNIIQYLLNTKYYNVIVPKSDFHDFSIKPVLINNFLNDLSMSKFGLLEPVSDLKFSGNIDYIFVPGIVFDINCFRIGYGKGFFDRFLPLYPKSYKIGLAYSFQILDALSLDNFDVSLDNIISEKGFLNDWI